MRIKIIVFALVFGCLSGCNNDDGVELSLNAQINQYVWSAMNLFYYWQSDVPNLADSKAGLGFESFLSSYESPETFFDDLIYEEEDRFSWIVDDYEELEASFQGVSKSYGFDLGLVRIEEGGDELLAYVRYIVEGGPAETAGMVRGDIFTVVDGSQLTIDNYINLLFESTSMTLTKAEIQDNNISQTDQQVDLVAIELTENPIFKSEVLDVESTKVGYLVYNQFINSNSDHEEMNNVFGTFKA